MTWVVVLLKDFAGAKTRLAAALGPAARSELARRNAELALAAAAAGDHVLAVASGPEAAALAAERGVEVLLEEAPAGQNPAAAAGLVYAAAQGARAVLLLSSDLPLVGPSTVAAMLARGARLPAPAVLAAPATGRGGTNALYLRPPDACALHFGDESLRKFEAEARRRGASFELFESAELALDLDEPSDLELLQGVS
ncbi:MAG TPA: 2-phospho-L-lactate guanylyltransferase [Candidatus Limnocylindrales bacterium]